MLNLGNSLLDKAQLGAGLSFPLREDPATGGFRRSVGEENVMECVQGLCLTRVGERVMAEDFGVAAAAQLFEPMRGALDVLPVQLAEAIQRYAPRLTQVRVTGVAEGTAVHLTVRGRIRATGQPLNRTFTIEGD